MTIENWTWFVEGLVIFALTCVLPFIARSLPADERTLKSLLGFVDAFGTILAMFLVALSFSNVWIGVFLTVFTLSILAVVFFKAFEADGSWGDTYWPKEEEQVEEAES